MNTIKTCPICGGTHYETHLELNDHMVTQEPFTIVKCGGCGFLFTNPVPEENELDKYYQSDVYVSHSSTSKGLINKIYNYVRSITLKQKKSWVQKYTKGKNLLDIGCGTGHFASLMQQSGYSVTGLEPDPIARENAKKLNNFSPLDTAALYELPENSADVITMWHVLEHVYHLERDIAQYAKLLKDDGVMLVAVPNPASYDAAYYKTYWAAYDVPRHLYHFTEKDVAALFSKVGFTMVDVLPMKFDSYYVSMLSEKYKKGSILNALRVGWLSNRKGKKQGYSSQVYVLRR